MIVYRFWDSLIFLANVKHLCEYSCLESMSLTGELSNPNAES